MVLKMTADLEINYRLLFQNMREAFFLAEPVYDESEAPADWRFLDANAAYAEMAGFPLEQIIGNLNSRLFPGAEPAWIKTIAQVARTGKPVTIEEYSDCTGRWYSIRYYSPQPGLTANIISDITESKLAEQNLAESQMITHTGSYSWDLGNHRLVWSEELYRILGLKPGQIQPSPETYYAHIHPDDREKVLGQIRLAIEKGITGPSEHRILLPDGTQKYVRVQSKIMRVREGKGVVLSGVVQDITERIKTEEALIRNKERFSRAFYSSPAPSLLVTIRQGRFVDVNESWLKLTGYDRDEVIGRTTRDLSIWAEPDYPVYIKTKLLNNGFVKNEAGQIRTKTGEVRELLWSAELDKVLGEDIVLVIAQDITEIKRAQDVLQKSKDLLEEMVRERTVQLSEINKDLLAEIEGRKRTEMQLLAARNDLRAMASEIILTEEKSKKQFAANLHDTVVQTLGAAKLRSQLLYEYLSEAGEMEFAELQSLLSQSIKEARQIMTDLSPPILHEFGLIPALEWLSERFGSQNGLNITFRGCEISEPLTQEVQTLLFQSARELLLNVVKHARAGNIRVSAIQIGHYIRVTVKDDGVGFNGKISFREDQCGYGLFSIRERLNHLGGNLVIKSKPGHGTRVSMVSPMNIEKFEPSRTWKSSQSRS